MTMHADDTDFKVYPFAHGITALSLKEFFVWCARQGVSDIHIQGGSHLVVGIHGRLRRASAFTLADEILAQLIDEVFGPEVRATVTAARPVDRALQLDGDAQQRYGLNRGERLRFRCNLVQATAGRLDKTLAPTLRVIPTDIPDLRAMGLEPDLFEALLPARGLGLMGGITGSGKTTLCAAIYRYCLNHYPDRKITTTEDPVEYILGSATDILAPTQLQIGRDVGSYAEAIRAHLRRAPSIIGVGEMRDLETLQAGILAGQLGHFCLSTLHIHSPGEAIARCLTLVPGEMREATARDLLGILQYVVVQMLLRTVDGRRQAIREYIVFDDVLRRDLDRMDYTRWGHHLDSLIKEQRRRFADQAWQLFQSGRIARSELAVAMTPHQLRELEELRY